MLAERVSVGIGQVDIQDHQMRTETTQDVIGFARGTRYFDDIAGRLQDAANQRLINVFVNPYGAYAKELGGLFFAAFKKYDGSVTARLKYVLAHYSQVEDDTGHSCTLNHYDAMQMDNPYWESPDYY